MGVERALFGVVGILFGVVVVVAVRCGGQVELRVVGRVVGGGAGVGDGVIDGGLEARQVEDQIGIAEASHVLRGELEVVRLGARGGQVADGDGVAADPFGHPLQGIEGCDHLDAGRAPARASLGGAAAGERERGDDGRGEHGVGEGAAHVDDPASK